MASATARTRAVRFGRRASPATGHEAGALRPDADQFRLARRHVLGNSPIPSPALTASMIIMAEFSSMATRPLPVGSPQKTSDQPGSTDC